eukprot:COSAG02_NODE_2182_length_9582_cov_4.266582_7_plen_85_part_00
MGVEWRRGLAGLGVLRSRGGVAGSTCGGGDGHGVSFRNSFFLGVGGLCVWRCWDLVRALWRAFEEGCGGRGCLGGCMVGALSVR